MTQLRRQSVTGIWSGCGERSGSSVTVCVLGTRSWFSSADRSRERPRRRQSAHRVLKGTRAPSLADTCKSASTACMWLAVDSSANVTSCAWLLRLEHGQAAQVQDEPQLAEQTATASADWQWSQRTGRCSSPACCVWTHGPERVQCSPWVNDGWVATGGGGKSTRW